MHCNIRDADNPTIAHNNNSLRHAVRAHTYLFWRSRLQCMLYNPNSRNPRKQIVIVSWKLRGKYWQRVKLGVGVNLDAMNAEYEN